MQTGNGEGLPSGSNLCPKAASRVFQKAKLLLWRWMVSISSLCCVFTSFTTACWVVDKLCGQNGVFYAKGTFLVPWLGFQVSWVMRTTPSPNCHFQNLATREMAAQKPTPWPLSLTKSHRKCSRYTTATTSWDFWSRCYNDPKHIKVVLSCNGKRPKPSRAE